MKIDTLRIQNIRLIKGCRIVFCHKEYRGVGRWRLQETFTFLWILDISGNVNNIIIVLIVDDYDLAILASEGKF